MCLAQGPQRSDPGEAQTRRLSISSQALYHWATALQITYCNITSLKVCAWGCMVYYTFQYISWTDWTHVRLNILCTTLLPVVSMHSQSEWKTVWILIRWLHQKPADLDLQCFQKRINPGSGGQELNIIRVIKPKNINEAWNEISNNVVCATSKASDQPAHMYSLIRAFASRLSILWVLSYWLNVIWISKLKRRLHRLAWVYNVKMPHYWKSHFAAQK